MCYNWKYIGGIIKYIEYIDIDINESFSTFVVARLDVTMKFYG